MVLYDNDFDRFDGIHPTHQETERVFAQESTGEKMSPLVILVRGQHVVDMLFLLYLADSLPKFRWRCGRRTQSLIVRCRPWSEHYPD